MNLRESEGSFTEVGINRGLPFLVFIYTGLIKWLRLFGRLARMDEQKSTYYNLVLKYEIKTQPEGLTTE